jgi:hypothetical protein
MSQDDPVDVAKPTQDACQFVHFIEIHDILISVTLA